MKIIYQFRSRSNHTRPKQLSPTVTIGSERAVPFVEVLQQLHTLPENLSLAQTGALTARVRQYKIEKLFQHISKNFLKKEGYCAVVFVEMYFEYKTHIKYPSLKVCKNLSKEDVSAGCTLAPSHLSPSWPQFSQHSSQWTATAKIDPHTKWSKAKYLQHS